LGVLHLAPARVIARFADAVLSMACRPASAVVPDFLDPTPMGVTSLAASIDEMLAFNLA